MKQSFSAVKWFVLALVCAGITSRALADTAQVISLKGAARYSTGNNQWLTLRVGDILNSGAVIQTASESTVDLLIRQSDEKVAPSPVVRRYTSGAGSGAAPEGTQNIVRLKENTVLALDKLTSEQTGADVVTDYQLDLRAGEILGNVKKLSAASRYEIKVPNGVAGIRGTFYQIRADGMLWVHSGSVIISYINAQGTLVTATVNAGSYIDLKTGIVMAIPPAYTATDEFGNTYDVSWGNAYSGGTTYTRVDSTIVTISPVRVQSFSN